MSRRRGVTLIKLALVSLWLLAAPLAQAISVGNLTFSLASDDEFVAKRVLNNNKSARLYRVSFREIPTRNLVMRAPAGGQISMEPVVVMDTILVARPRQVQFKWAFDKTAGSVSNTGNTWFKLLIKPGCDTTEGEGDAWYLRPGDVVRQSSLRKPGNHYIIYNEKFIKLNKDCQGK